MRKQAIRAASALPLICSIGFASAVRAEPSSGGRPLSANCKQAWADSDSRLMSVPKILCREEDAYDEAIVKFIRETVPAPLNASPAPVRQPGPKFPRRKKAERRRSTKPRKTAKEKGSKANSGKNHFAAHQKAHQKNIAMRRARAAKQRRAEAARLWLQRQREAAFAAAVRDLHLGVDLNRLTPKQRREVRGVLESLLARMTTIAFLNALQQAEGGGPLVIVGGLRGKSADCRRRIGALDFSAHPKEQGLPNRCFLKTRKYGLSTAAGSWQIVYYRNWRSLRQLLGLEDFRERRQALAALELVRSSAARGGKIGEGIIALLRNDLDGAIRKGSDPWASSPHSRWSGRKDTRLLEHAREELAKLRDEEYARKQLKRFGKRPTPETAARPNGAF